MKIEHDRKPKGTTPGNRRPYKKEYPAGQIYIPTVLMVTGMAQSKGEGRRMLNGGLWIDRWGDFPNPEGTAIWDRLEKLKGVADITVKPGWRLCVGKTINQAICHGICFIEN